MYNKPFKKLRSILVFSIIFLSIFITIKIEPVKADDSVKEAQYSFESSIFWNATSGNFSDTNDSGEASFIRMNSLEGELKNISLVAISHDTVTNVITFQLTQNKIYDDDGWEIEQDTRTYVTVRKEILASALQSGDIENIAIKDYYYRSCDENASLNGDNKDWMRIELGNFTTAEISIALYSNADVNETWYTKGNNETIKLRSRAMFINKTVDSIGHVEFDIDHPANTNGQTVYINKSWIQSKGITNPYFEWGDKIPWMHLDYTETSTHYVLNPEHFSSISVHNASSGTTYAYQKGSTYNWTTQEILGHTFGGTSVNTNSGGGTSMTSPVISTTITLDFDAWLVGLSNGVRFNYETYHWGSCNSDPYAVHDYYTYNKLYPSYPYDSNHYSDTFGHKYHQSYYEWESPGDGDYTVYAYTNVRYDWYNTLQAGIWYQGTSTNLALYEDGTNITYNSTWRIKQDAVERTIGESSEVNYFNWSGTPETYQEDAIVAVPVSTESTAVQEVYNIVGEATLTEGSSYDDINENQFYYDAANYLVFFCLDPEASTHRYYVNTTYGAYFDIVPPTFLTSGQYFMANGLIRDEDGDTINNLIATTSIRGTAYAEDSYYTSNFTENFTSAGTWELSSTEISGGHLNLSGASMSGWAWEIYPYVSGIDEIELDTTDSQVNGTITYSFSDDYGSTWSNLSGDGTVDFDGTGQYLYMKIYLEASDYYHELWYQDTQDDLGDYHDVIMDDDGYLHYTRWAYGISAYTFLGEFSSLIDTDDAGTQPYANLCYDGTYIYVACHYDGIRAYRFQDNHYVLEDTYDYGTYWVFDVTVNDTYLFAAIGEHGFGAFTFDGDTITKIAVEELSGEYAVSIDCDDNYVYVTRDNDGLNHTMAVYSFDGSSFTFLDGVTDSVSVNDVTVDDSGIIHCACGGDGVRAYSFDGSDLTLLDTQDDGNNYYRVDYNGSNVFAGCGSEGLRAYNFTDNEYTFLDSHDIGGVYYSGYINSTHAFWGAGSSGAVAYKFTTNASSNEDLYVDEFDLSVTVEPYPLEDVELVSAKHNCSNGNYDCKLATNSLVPGLYGWVIQFTDPDSGVTFKKSGPLWLDIPISGGGGGGGNVPYASAHLYYSFFDLNTGTGLTDDFFKIYISPDTTFNEGDRVKGGVKPTYLGQTLYFKITDYFNNKLYPVNGSYYSIYIDEAEYYIDCGINLRQFRIKNMNDSTIYFIIRDDETDLQVGRWIPPYEEAEYFLLDNIYNITIQYYDSATAMLETTVNLPNFEINSDTFYCIPGYSLADIVIVINNANTTILDQIINIGVNINNDGSDVINQVLNSNVVLANIESNITYQTTTLEAYIDNINTSIHNQITGVWIKLNVTNSSIYNQTTLILTNVENTNNNITSMNNTMVMILADMNNSIGSMNSTIITFLGIINNNISTFNQNIYTAIIEQNTNITSMNQSIHVEIGQVNNNVSYINQTIVAQFGQINNDITWLNQTVVQVMGQVNTNVTVLSQNVAQYFVQQNQNITSLRENITQWIGQTNINITNMNLSIYSILGILNANITNLSIDITQMQISVIENVTNVEMTLTQQILQQNNNISYINQSISVGIAQINDNVGALNQTIINQIAQQNNNISYLNQTIIQLVAQMNTNISNLSQDIVQMITQQNTNISDFEQFVSQIIGQQNQNITNLNQTIISLFASTNQNITNVDSHVTYIHTSINENISIMNQSIHSHITVANVNTTSLMQNMTSFFVCQNTNITNLSQNLTSFFGALNTNIGSMNQSIAALIVLQNTNISNLASQQVTILNAINNANSSILSQTTTIMTLTMEINSTIYNRTQTIMTLINCTNATVAQKAIEVLNSVFDNSTWVFNRVGSAIDTIVESETNLSNEIVIRSLNIIDNVTSKNNYIINKTLNILENLTYLNMSINVNFSQALDILDQIIVYNDALVNYTLSIIDLVTGEINISIDPSIFANFTAILQSILDQFQLPHEWRLPQVNYSINDTVPPISSISASCALTGGITVHWTSTDNNPLFGVAYVTIYYRVEGGAWRIWKAITTSAGSALFDSSTQTLTNGSVYWFKCIGVDLAGNVENESDSNTCNVTYVVYETPGSTISDPTDILTNALTSPVFLVGIILILIVAIALVLLRKRNERQMRIEAARQRGPIHYEGEY